MTNSTRGKLYRSRRKKYTDGLAEHVEKLRKEVEELQIYHQTQQATLVHTQRNPDMTSSFVRVVCEYFSLFEFGVPVVADGGATSCDALVRSSRQATFLNAMMHPHMSFGGTHGVQLLLDQWERYSMYHTKLQFRLHSLDVVVADGENPVISAKAILRVRFSRFTIQKVFPHIMWNEALVQRLINLDAVEYPVGNTFYFGPDGKIHGYETEVDFVEAFLRALGSIQDAIALVDHALIKQQHMIGEAEQEEELGEQGGRGYKSIT
uniref:BZIP domain-containing protein n=1 Tax=Globisporangium ultimum (strain ATCC 200006 / CBS 805.95 / DAOM BR144) TaxID=431595 RepID=K3WNP2_GLOUD